MSEIPTMEQCIDRRCYCITKDSPRGYPGLSPEYQDKLRRIQAELRADYDARMSAADKAGRDFGRTMNLICVGIIVALCLLAWSAFARDRNIPAEFQKLYPCESTGKKTGPCPTHVRDHVIPLACGGPDSIDNMVWQTVEEGKAKDRWERQCWRWWHNDYAH